MRKKMRKNVMKISGKEREAGERKRLNKANVNKEDNNKTE